MLGTSHDSVAQPVVPFTDERMAPNRTQGERADARKGRAHACAHACVRFKCFYAHTCRCMRAEACITHAKTRRLTSCFKLARLARAGGSEVRRLARRSSAVMLDILQKLSGKSGPNCQPHRVQRNEAH